MNKYPYFCSSEYPAFVALCKKLFSRDEPSAILTYPESDLGWRAEQLKQDFEDQFEDGIEILHFSEKWENDKLLEKYIGNTGRNVFFDATDKKEHEDIARCINTLIRNQRKRGTYRCIILMSFNILEPPFSELVHERTLSGNLAYFPLYSPLVAKEFIAYSENMWQIYFSKEIKKHLIDHLGGDIWLLKQAIRIYREKSCIDCLDFLKEPSMLFRLNAIWQGFSPTEQELLRNSAFGNQQNIDSTSSPYHFLSETGVIGKIGQIQVPLLAEYITNIFAPTRVKKVGKIFAINDIPMEYILSHQEQLLFSLLAENEGKTVSKDMIAEGLWKDDSEERFSPWAIEQLVKRLRLKLTKAGMGKKTIKTVRNQGYMFFQ